MIDMDELRDILNEVVELREENVELRRDLVEQCKTVSSLRSHIGKLLDKHRKELGND